MLPTSCPTRSKLVSKMRTIASVQIWGPNMRPKNGSHQVVQNDPNWFIKRELPFESMGPVAQADPNLPRPPPTTGLLIALFVSYAASHPNCTAAFSMASGEQALPTIANRSWPILSDSTCSWRKLVSKEGLTKWYLTLVSTNGFTKWSNANGLQRWSIKLVSRNSLNKWFQNLVSANGINHVETSV